MKRKGKNVWKMKKGSVLPQGVVVVKDLTDEGHYMMAPELEMPFKKFLGLLEEFGCNQNIAVKLSPQEIMQ